MNKTGRSLLRALYYGLCIVSILTVVLRISQRKQLNEYYDVETSAREKSPSAREIEENGRGSMQAAFENTPNSPVAKNMDYWDVEIHKKKFANTMPNPDFIFHNKLPKSGSTTMYDILQTLQDRHKFNFMKVVSEDVSIGATKDLVDYINKNGGVQKPFFLLKHNPYFNWTEYGGEQPTFINVIRDPLDWITSRYYFARFGWGHNPGCRGRACKKGNLTQEMDECVKFQVRECLHDWDYLKYFCGSGPGCSDLHLGTYEQKVEAAERAKYNILHNYFIVGILEQFEDTLTVFERLMPSYYEGALSAYTTDQLQSARNQTKTSYKKELSEESKEFLRNGVMKPEVEVYEFAKKIFNLRMQQMNIQPVIKEES